MREPSRHGHHRMFFREILLAAALALLLGACKQPFEPDGPSGNTLIVYGILNNATDTQYVRLATTYRAGIDPTVTGASVSVTIAGNIPTPPAVSRSVAFHDTVIDRVDVQGVVEHLPMYVAYHFRPIAGATYQISARTAGAGVSAQATTTILYGPDAGLMFDGSLRRDGNQQIVLDVSFPSARGACELRFYVEYYAYVQGGWELHREEVPQRSYKDDAGKEIFVYPALTPVTTLVGSDGKAGSMVFDTTQYRAVLRRVAEQYSAPHVVFLQAAFVLTQVDDILYSYYYLNNGVIDQSSVRLDVPEFTNIQGGLGVFGSGAVVRKTYTLLDF